MSAAVYLLVCVTCGWLAARVFCFLHRARDEAGWKPVHWFIFLSVVGAAMLFAKFGIGLAPRHFQINDAVVGAGGITMLVVFAVRVFISFCTGRK